MPSVLSKVIPYMELSLPFNCYEVGHTWTPSCSKAALDIGWFAFSEALKMYAGLYLFGQVMAQRYDRKSFRETLKSILRSSSFIGFNAFTVLSIFCFSYRSVGKLYLSLMGHFPSAIGSFLAIHLEKPSRRGPLAFYVANIAAETLYLLLLSKKLIKPLPYGEVVLFSLATSVMMVYIHKNGFSSDAISTILKVVIGQEEAKYLQRNAAISSEKQQVGFSQRSSLNNVYHFDRSMMYKVIAFIQSLSTSSPTCPHSDISCLKYVSKAFINQFLFAWSGFGIMRTLFKTKPSNYSKAVILNNFMGKDAVSFSLFASTFTCIYRLTSCILRLSKGNSKSSDKSILETLLPGLMAGLSMAFYPSKTIAQYTFWKMVEIAFFDAVKRGKISNHELIVKTLYSISCSQLFFVAAISPDNLRPSYMKFLDRVTHRALHLLNRNILDLFGTNSSSGFNKFLPNLDINHTSRPFQEAVLVWTIR